VPTVQVGDIELFYELRRTADEPVVLLIAGLGGQMISWDEGLCDAIGRSGFGVLRFDNRDTGLSSSIESPGSPAELLAEIFTNPAAVAPYNLADMAEDAAGLLEALGIAEAHVVGVSMGGMIAQALAIAHPELVASLCSIMSMTGARDSGMPTQEALDVLMAPPPEGRDAYIDSQVVVWKVIGSPGFPFDEDGIRDRAARAYDRSFRPDGVLRQFVAIIASPDRTEALGSVSAPTLVVHGTEDRLVTPSGGAATAAAVPGARLLEIPGMGHDLPVAVWPELVEAIAANTRRRAS
jgi:pimeloyl-ACP methyl ester carboxylesterase